MYCPHFHLENRDCNGICTACPYGCMPFAPFQEQFKYECPECHGKFNEAIYKTTTIVNYGLIGCPTELIYRYVCPFCSKIMEGLS